jgi:hypothetical protein
MSNESIDKITLRRRFLQPVNAAHRQYEALRAFFVEGLPSQEAARRLGYSPGSFRILVHRFRQDPAPSIRSVDPLALRTAFLYRVQRQVTKTGHVHFHGNRYAVPGFLVGQKVELRYDPFDLRDVEVWFNGQCLAQAEPLHMQVSTEPGVTPDPAPIAAPTTGIDYLAMLRQERERLLREQLPPIPFTRLTSGSTGG